MAAVLLRRSAVLAGPAAALANGSNRHGDERYDHAKQDKSRPGRQEDCEDADTHPNRCGDVSGSRHHKPERAQDQACSKRHSSPPFCGSAEHFSECAECAANCEHECDDSKDNSLHGGQARGRIRDRAPLAPLTVPS